jgi:hypothetical protein
MNEGMIKAYLQQRALQTHHPPPGHPNSAEGLEQGMPLLSTAPFF